MATRKRPGAAKRTVAKQEAARKRSARGKRFVGETADQSEKARRDERRKVARMARSAARKASPGEAARTVERPKRASAKRGPGSAGDRAARTVARAQAAFRAAEEDAARRGAEVEPAVPSERPGADDPAAQTRERPSLHLLSEVAEAEPAASEPPYEPSVDVSDAESAIGEAPPPPLGLAVADLARSALGLVRTLVGVPFRIALAIPRLALRAIASV